MKCTSCKKRHNQRSRHSENESLETDCSIDSKVRDDGIKRIVRVK